MKKIGLAFATAAALVMGGALTATAQAMPAGPLDSPGVAASLLHQTQFFIWSGRHFCWYWNGWNGPGWYWCGYAWRRGFGWGGPRGWHGWHPGPRPGFHPGPHFRPGFHPGPHGGPHGGPHNGPHGHHH